MSATKTCLILLTCLFLWFRRRVERRRSAVRSLARPTLVPSSPMLLPRTSSFLPWQGRTRCENTWGRKLHAKRTHLDPRSQRPGHKCVCNLPLISSLISYFWVKIGGSSPTCLPQREQPHAVSVSPIHSHLGDVNSALFHQSGPFRPAACLNTRFLPQGLREAPRTGLIQRTDCAQGELTQGDVQLHRFSDGLTSRAVPEA